MWVQGSFCLWCCQAACPGMSPAEGERMLAVLLGQGRKQQEEGMGLTGQLPSQVRADVAGLGTLKECTVTKPLTVTCIVLCSSRGC